MTILNTPRDHRAQAPCSNRPRWKHSRDENRILSFYGLKITLLRSARQGTWCVSVVQNDGKPTFTSHPNKEVAEAYAEETFLCLKQSGKFGPAPRQPLRGRCTELTGIDGKLRIDFQDHFVEIKGVRERQGKRADLFNLEFKGRRTNYWVPHSQGFVVREEAGICRLIVTRWWWDRAEPTR